MKLKSTTVKTEEQWRDTLITDKHWKDGHSAKELASYILDGNEGNGEMPRELKSAIESTGIKNQDYKWKPEHETRFGNGFGSGYGRNHDLALWGDDTFIGIEAKVNEDFDNNKVRDWIVKKNSEGSVKNRTNRINAMCKLIFGEEYNNNKDYFGELRYQLFSALTGVVKEAKKSGKKNAILIIITFDKKDKDGKCVLNDISYNENKKDFESFITKIEKSEDYKATGRVSLKDETEINVFIKVIPAIK